MSLHIISKTNAPSLSCTRQLVQKAAEWIQTRSGLVRLRVESRFCVVKMSTEYDLYEHDFERILIMEKQLGNNHFGWIPKNMEETCQVWELPRYKFRDASLVGVSVIILFSCMNSETQIQSYDWRCALASRSAHVITSREVVGSMSNRACKFSMAHFPWASCNGTRESVGVPNQKK